MRIGTPRYPDNELMMRDTGHGKRSAVLDLASPEGAGTLRTLAKDAHVFAQGYRPGTIAARGFGPEDLAATVFYLLGIEPNTIVTGNGNRPVMISEGKPVMELLA